MFKQAIDDTARKNLESLGKLSWQKQFYLAGGTAAALQLGHRRSFDLDFFSLEDFDHNKIRQDLAGLGKLSVEQTSPNTFLGSLNGLKISFFRYPYPLINPTKEFIGVKIADLKDIAAMKLDAISTRGKKRDFIDLYFIAEETAPLEDLFKVLEKKFANLNISKFHLLKSLDYFTDADTDPMPEMIKRVEWDEVKKFFEIEVKRLAHQFGMV